MPSTNQIRPTERIRCRKGKVTRFYVPIDPMASAKVKQDTMRAFATAKIAASELPFRRVESYRENIRVFVGNEQILISPKLTA